MSLLSSLRGRLAVISAVVIAAILALAGLGLSWLFESYIERRVAEELRGRVLELAGAFELDGKGEPSLRRAPSDPRYRDPYSGIYWYVREGETVVLRSRSLWDAKVAPRTLDPGVVADGEGPDNQQLYVLERPLVLGEGLNVRRFTLGVGLNKAEIVALSSSFGWELAAGLGFCGLLLFGGAWLQASYGLSPLNAIRSQLGKLHAGEKEQLEGPFPSEIAPLASDLNHLFNRQKLLIAKARERAGTLAHGLKTPMTVLYGEARRLELAGDVQGSKIMRDQLDLMHRQVERELSRARTHGESAAMGLQTDVHGSAERLVELMKRMPRGGALEWHLPPRGLYVPVDADDFGEILGNVLHNARKWASRAVWIGGESAASKVVVWIDDDGPGMDSAYRLKAVERGESGMGSSGLGLTIVADLCEANGTQLDFQVSPYGGLRVRLDMGS